MIIPKIEFVLQKTHTPVFRLLVNTDKLTNSTTLDFEFDITSVSELEYLNEKVKHLLNSLFLWIKQYCITHNNDLSFITQSSFLEQSSRKSARKVGHPSLRQLHYFLSRNCHVINGFNNTSLSCRTVTFRNTYRKQLRSYGKSLFDPFNRSNDNQMSIYIYRQTQILEELVPCTKVIKTNIAQLNFYRFYLEHFQKEVLYDILSCYKKMNIIRRHRMSTHLCEDGVKTYTKVITNKSKKTHNRLFRIFAINSNCFQ